jgi:hypothetical protein
MLKTIAFSELNLKKRQIVNVNLKPAEAAALLQHNTDNRRIRRSLVKYLITQISQQEWRDDHPQPIVFSDSRLIDGQHRLTAISQSGWEDGCVVRIETMASDKVREYLDTGAPRSLADRVSVVENRSYNEWIMRIVNAATDVKSGGGSTAKRPTPEDAREYYDVHKTEMDAVYRSWKKIPGLGIFSVALAAVEYAALDTEKAIAFYDDFFTPAGHINQAQILRDALLRNADGHRTGRKRKELYEKSVSCMKAHMEDREIKRAVCGTW